jgi:hypothetical protein
VSARDALSDSIDEDFGFGEDDASKQSRADMVIVTSKLSLWLV